MTTLPLCRVEEIPAAGAIGRELQLGSRNIPVIILRHAGTVAAYLNSCPHVGVRLEWRPDDFLDASGRFLQCATHGAIFEKARGHCLEGPCRGASLIPVAIWVDPDGQVWALEADRVPATARRAGWR